MNLLRPPNQPSGLRLRRWDRAGWCGPFRTAVPRDRPASPPSQLAETRQGPSIPRERRWGAGVNGPKRGLIRYRRRTRSKERQSANHRQETRMIDLHCHILPGIDDGATDIRLNRDGESLRGRRRTVVACTPHILPGLYANSGPQIRNATAALQQTLDQEGIPLRLVTGADNHVTPICGGAALRPSPLLGRYAIRPGRATASRGPAPHGGPVF